MIWPEVREWVAAGLERGVGYLPEDIYHALLVREMVLWVVRSTGGLQACAITVLWAQPRVRVCDIILVGGQELEKWSHLIAEVEAYAKAQGADEVRAHGRAGWKREAREHGFETLCTVFRKKLK